MNQDLINRYQPGGDIYAELEKTYGTGGADKIARAALGGDRSAVTNAIAAVKYGSGLSTSTSAIFLEQIVTDPLAAPTDSLNNQLGLAFKNVFGKPWLAFAVLLILGLTGIYLFGNPFKKKSA